VFGVLGSSTTRRRLPVSPLDNRCWLDGREAKFCYPVSVGARSYAMRARPQRGVCPRTSLRRYLRPRRPQLAAASYAHRSTRMRRRCDGVRRPLLVGGLRETRVAPQACSRAQPRCGLALIAYDRRPNRELDNRTSPRGHQPTPVVQGRNGQTSPRVDDPRDPEYSETSLIT